MLSNLEGLTRSDIERRIEALIACLDYLDGGLEEMGGP